MSDLYGFCEKNHCDNCDKFLCLYNEQYGSIKDVQVFPESKGGYRVQVKKSLDFGEEGISVGDFLSALSEGPSF